MPICVSDVMEILKAGSVATVLEKYPELEKEDVQAAIEFTEITKGIGELQSMSNAIASRELTVEQAELYFSMQIEREEDGIIANVSFGYCHNFWEELKSKMQSGDRIIEATSSTESWRKGMGSSAITLERPGQEEPVAVVPLKMN